MSISAPTNAPPLPGPTPGPVVYPETDGAPIADNTLQFRWIVTIKGNLDLVFAEQPDIFVAGDLFWYPVQGNTGIVQAPDVFVAFGRPRGERGSYKQWEEEGIAPQVVFEILSLGNTFKEMLRKFAFYEQYGVEEYYIFDPYKMDLTVYVREQNKLVEIANPQGWTSPRLQCRFEIIDNDLVITGPDGRRFQTVVEMGQRAKQLEQAADRLREQLRALGVEPKA